MLKTPLYFFLFLLLPFSLFGQVNLVPNPGFESYSSCPNNWDQLSFADNWQVYKGTPDYYNSCGAVDSFDIPHNLMGTQNAASGNAYCGMILYDKSNFGLDEMVGTSLTQPLTIGTKYFISFKVVWKYNNPYSICCSNDKIGIKLSMISFNVANPPPQNNFAHVYSSTIISDTSNWTRISGSVIADSAYSYLMIGNFFDSLNVSVNDQFPTGYYSYYFLDDICISTDSIYASNFSTSIPYYSPNENNILVYPNPVEDYFNISVSPCHNYDLVIYNSIGQIVFQQKNVSFTTNRINVSAIKEDLLIVEIVSKNQLFHYKLLKQ